MCSIIHERQTAVWTLTPATARTDRRSRPVIVSVHTGLLQRTANRHAAATAQDHEHRKLASISAFKIYKHRNK